MNRRSHRNLLTAFCSVVALVASMNSVHAYTPSTKTAAAKVVTTPELSPEKFRSYVEKFNTMELETITTDISNVSSWDWMKTNAPFFECPDKSVEETYYFRLWSYRKHIKKTPAGFVVTEFLGPIGHAGAFNTISCAFGFHLAEGRWLRQGAFLDDYSRFWFRGANGKVQPHFHKFSSWAASAIYNRALVNGDRAFAVSLLDDLIADYAVWETERGTPEGLFWQFDVRDGMEESISGSRKDKNRRPTISSYMYANARAIAVIARWSKRYTVAKEFDAKADKIQAASQNLLWDEAAQFWKVRRESGEFSDAREEIGFVPWMFNLPHTGTETAWKQLRDTNGFLAPAGITTAERRHPKFRTKGIGTCEWDGAVWPFATSQTLTGLANLLRSQAQSEVSNRDYFDAFLTYTRSQQKDGKPYIGEYMDEKTGEWIKVKDGERSRYYNHSSYADLLINGVVGLIPRDDNVVELKPLLPSKTWDYFALDKVPYHGQLLSIFWDATGQRYGVGQGLSVFCNGKLIARSSRLERVAGLLPASPSSAATAQ